MVRIIFLVVVFSAFTFHHTSADIVSTFDSDLDGWTTDNSGVFQHVSTGGNPDGFLSLDNDENDIARIFAPGKFLGDLSSFDGGTISFDGSLLGDGGTFFEGPDDYGVITIMGSAGMASFDLVPGGATAPLNSWEKFSANLDASTWGVSQTEWNAILADVTSLSLSVEALFGSEVNGIDNFRIAAIPEPSSSILLGAALATFGFRCRRRRAG